jgi:hypothetical protein
MPNVSIGKNVTGSRPVQAFDAISRTEEGDDGHSILQKDMPDDEKYHCEPNKRRKLRYSPLVLPPQ